jgi:hypothetical protein
MSGPPRESLTTPAGLAGALLRRPVTPGRVRKLLRLLRGHPPVYIAQTLAAIPDPLVRATVADAVKTAGLFIE